MVLFSECGGFKGAVGGGALPSRPWPSTRGGPRGPMGSTGEPLVLFGLIFLQLARIFAISAQSVLLQACPPGI